MYQILGINFHALTRSQTIGLAVYFVIMVATIIAAVIWYINYLDHRAEKAKDNFAGHTENMQLRHLSYKPSALDYQTELKLFKSMQPDEQVRYMNMTRDQKIAIYGSQLSPNK